MADQAQQAAELQQLQRQLQMYDRHLASLEQNLAELQNAVATLSGIAGEGVLETRIPIGAGARIAATVDPGANVVMDIGAGYATELPAADALATLRDQLQAAEATFKATSQEAERLGQRMQELQMQPSAS